MNLMHVSSVVSCSEVKNYFPSYPIQTSVVIVCLTLSSSNVLDYSFLSKIETSLSVGIIFHLWQVSLAFISRYISEIKKRIAISIQWIFYMNKQCVE